MGDRCGYAAEAFHAAQWCKLLLQPDRLGAILRVDHDAADARFVEQVAGVHGERAPAAVRDAKAQRRPLTAARLGEEVLESRERLSPIVRMDQLDGVAPDQLGGLIS